MLLFFLAILPLALGVRPGFHKGTGSVEWRDCGVGAKWVSLQSFDISPSPIKLPGDMMVSLHGKINHHLENSVTLDVLMQKELLGRFTNVICSQDVGTCHYTDPCRFLSTFKRDGNCPAQLIANKLPCTCPFNPDVLNLPATKFTVTSISNQWQILATGNYHIKVTMNDKATKQERACLEAYMSITV